MLVASIVAVLPEPSRSPREERKVRNLRPFPTTAMSSKLLTKKGATAISAKGTCGSRPTLRRGMPR